MGIKAECWLEYDKRTTLVKKDVSIFLHVVSDIDFTLVKPVVMAIGQHQLQALAKCTSALSDAFCAS